MNANIKNIADLIVLSIENHINWDNFYLPVGNYPTIKKINSFVNFVACCDSNLLYIRHSLCYNLLVNL